MNLVTRQTAELQGTALNWAMAYATHAVPIGTTFDFPKAEGPWETVTIERLHINNYEYSPTTDWKQCGPLIEKYKISVWERCHTEPLNTGWSAIADIRTWGETSNIDRDESHGPTALIAACRAIVAAELGDTVQIPEELA